MKHTAVPYDLVHELNQQQQQPHHQIHQHHNNPRNHHHHPLYAQSANWTQQNNQDTHDVNSIMYANYASSHHNHINTQQNHLNQYLNHSHIHGSHLLPNNNINNYYHIQQNPHHSHHYQHPAHNNYQQVAPEIQQNHSDLIVQAILAAKDALEKPIEERDDRDIMLIDNLCSLVHGFDVYPKAIRRALATQAVLIVIEETDKLLIVHNEELDSFCVLIFGECEQLDVTKTVTVRNYQVGDSFGVCEPTTDTIRFNGHMVTKCENCAFLCVKRDDFYAILTDPANYPNKETIKHKDRNGNIVCVSQYISERKSSGPLWTNHQMQSATNPVKIVLPDGHIIIKATEACLLMSLVDGYDKMDPDYVDDFLLLFRVFMTYDQREKERKLPPGMIKLCLTLCEWLNDVNYRDKVIKIVISWLSSYDHDFELASEFSYLFFRVLESKLLELSMHSQLHLLHVTLSSTSRVRQVTISKSSREQPLTFTISGGYEKNCGIFVTQVMGSKCDELNHPYEILMNFLRYGPRPSVPPRLKISSNQPINPYLQESRSSTIQLRPGDQILEVNGTNFAAIKLVEAQKKLDMSTHLSLTVRYNPSAFNEMKALPDGRRKSSISSVSSVSPYTSQNVQSKFNFNTQDILNNFAGGKQNDQYPPASPLFSSNANFGFKSRVKIGAKNDKSRLSSLINSSKQFVKQMRDTTVQVANNLETMSKNSDNTSDTQSNDIDINNLKAKSNPDLANLKTKDRLIESGLNNIVGLDDLKTDNAVNGSNNNQTLVNVLRVFNAANNDSRYLLIHEETTAREVVMVAVKEFNLTAQSSNQSPNDKSLSSLNWYLYEVSVVPESKTIKQKCLSEQTNKLAERASLSSRFYIKQCSGGPTRLDTGDDALVNEILKESPPTVNLTSLNATLLAVELTLADFDKFKSIQPQQFVYDTFFDYKEQSQSSSSGTSSADSASLKSSSSDGQEPDILHIINKTRQIPKTWVREYQDFADICNKEMFWVICEILSERNIGRRVKIVKQFIRVADVCSQLRNYNSMFAIISGLGHSCVGRLKRTFEKLKPKYKNQLEKMRGLFDPSRNMSNYRDCLKKTPPPAIPLFPQIKKDLTFQKEGRSIFIRETCETSDEEEYSQDTIKRRSRDNLLTTVKSSSLLDTPAHNINALQSSKSISYSAFTNGHRLYNSNSTDYDNILINFAEIRQFTDRVRNVIYFSSIPYSNDLLTNTKDNQRNQAQIKKMHEECQMRKRIRHYIETNLNCDIVSNSQSNEKLDQVDGYSSSLPKNIFKPGKLSITFDEKTLYQRSLEVEPELNVRSSQTTSQVSESRHYPQQSSVLYPSISSGRIPLTAPLSMHAPPSSTTLNPASNSPTLSKSSSLSSCSSFNHHTHHHVQNYHAVRSNNLTSCVGKFGTESTESLRKLRALSENVDDWKPYHNEANNHHHNNNNNSNSTNCNNNRLGNNNDLTSRTKGIVTSRIFPGKGNR